MRLFSVALATFLFLSFLSPEYAGENTKSHASANIIPETRIESGISYLQKIRIREKAVQNELCGITAFSDFFGSPRAVIVSALEDIPCNLVQGLKDVVIYDDLDKPRALASATSLHLRYDTLNLPEARKVLVHELGHVVDLGGIKSTSFAVASDFRDGNATVYADDPSVDFYSISWKHNTAWTDSTKRTDFVTGYAATDPFEDFAESFLFYIDYGNAFRAMAKEYPRLQKKYDFLRDTVFNGREFFTGATPEDLSAREWDATKLDASH